jgi:hypothetical protein
LGNYGNDLILKSLEDYDVDSFKYCAVEPCIKYWRLSKPDTGSALYKP